MSEQPKFCKECRYFDPIRAMISIAECEHTSAYFLDLVTGKPRQMSCEAMRINRCGPEGKLWEPKA